jgi:hypothetical protein
MRLLLFHLNYFKRTDELGHMKSGSLIEKIKMMSTS